MKILILNYEYPPLGGGAGVCTQNIAEGLVKKENEVTIITTCFKKQRKIYTKKNLKIVSLNCKRKYIYKSSIFEKISWINHSKKYLEKYCKKNEFDICIANFTIPGGVVGKFLKKKFQIPYIVISHGHDIPWFFPKQMLKYHLTFYFWIKSICKNCEKLILLTPEMKKNADKFMGKEKWKNIIIPNGLKTTKKNLKKNEDNKLKIIFVGRLTKQKDPMTFLKGIKEFSKHTENFTVNILGDGPLRKKCERYIKKNHLGKKIHFLGWIDKNKIAKEYQSTDIQVITSINEAMSITTLESLSFGNYLLSTPVSGNKDLIKKGINGDFFRKKNNKELGKKLIKYYKEKFEKNYQIPKKEIENIIKKHSWKDIIIKYHNLLKNILLSR